MAAGYASVCGIDEAGRGPWAGPVVAAAVILDPASIPSGLNDSKKLSEARREALFERLGLREHLTPQRSNGFRSMVDRIRRDAQAALGGALDPAHGRVGRLAIAPLGDFEPLRAVAH